MANDTMQFEKQAVETAQQELAQARQAFAQQMQAFQAAADKVMRQTGEYRAKRQFWLN